MSLARISGKKQRLPNIEMSCDELKWTRGYRIIGDIVIRNEFDHVSCIGSRALTCDS